MYKYIIGSGWWCGNNNGRQVQGDDFIRGEKFHKIWYNSIIKNTNPQKILIIDSDSPVKPDLNKDDLRLEFVSLNKNWGHSTNLEYDEKYCGWTASVILGLQYAYFCDTDYFVYIEQDVILVGKGIIEEVIKKMEVKKLNYAFGSPGNTPQPLQQSFFIIKKNYILKFINNILAIRYSDRILGPEYKFAIAVDPICKFLPKCLFLNIYFRYIYRKICMINYMDIGFGRDRPIDFNLKYYYFQHGKKDEINKLIEMGEIT
ncbi:TPA: hypothetical protein I0E88_000726 [Escherichia coli]|nr:hypothetical protein [Escherichia coli]